MFEGAKKGFGFAVGTLLGLAFLNTVFGGYADWLKSKETNDGFEEVED